MDWSTNPRGCTPPRPSLLTGCTLMLLWATLINGQDVTPNVVRFGNEVKQTTASSDSGGIVFLLSEIKLSKGVVFAFEAYYAYIQPVRFQVWRPVQPPLGSRAIASSDEYYRLVGELKVTPPAQKDISVAFFTSNTCIVAQDGDRLGLYEEGTVGAVGYQFNLQYPKVLSYNLLNTSVPANVGDTVQFSVLTFPYVFALAAYVDTALANYPTYVTGSDFVQCSQNAKINKLAPSSTLKPPTGAPGAIGPAGVPGPQGPQGSEGATGATGPTGPFGPPGFIGTKGATGLPGGNGLLGATGPIGKFGSTGPRGENGATGAQGVRGMPGPQGNTALQSSSATSDFFSNPITVLILFIWLAIVTFLLILILALIITMRKRRKDEERMVNRMRKNESFTASMGPGVGGVGGGDGQEQGWLGTMKEDSEADFSNDTIIVDGKRRSRRHHALNNNTAGSTPPVVTTNLSENSKLTSSDSPEMMSTMRNSKYEQPPDIMASSQPPISPIPSPSSPPTSPRDMPPTTPGLRNEFPFENEISSTPDTITRTYDNQGNLSQDNIHMIRD